MFFKNFTISGGVADNGFNTEKGYGTWEPHIEKNLMPTASGTAIKSGGWSRRVFEKKLSLPDREVLIIKTEVPSFGTYKVKVSISSEYVHLEDLIIFSGRRNMISRGNIVDAGSFCENEFYAAVMPYIPELSSDRCNDKSLFISLYGKNLLYIGEDGHSPELKDGITVSVEISEEQVPVIWLAGDSTLTEQSAGIPYFPRDSFGGWGQVLPMFIRGAAVCNLAHSGLTTNCFRDDGHYAIFLEFMKPDDVLILQFGHNDQKRRNLKPFKGYYNNLLRYAAEAKKAKVRVIICSPVSRIPFSLSDKESRELDMPRRYSLLDSFDKAAKKAALDSGVSFADIHELTFNEWVRLEDECRNYFINGDITHTNDIGSMLIAGMFMEECRRVSSNPINDFDNDADSGISVTASDMQQAPAQVYDPEYPVMELPYVDIPKIRDCIFINEALKYGILDPCVMHLHPDEEMPRGQFLMTMFKAIHKDGVRPYHKKYADLEVDEWDSAYVQALIDENLIDDITIKRIGDKLFFRPDDALSYGEYASFLIRAMEKDKNKRNISMEECLRRAYELDIIGDICKGNENDFDFCDETDSEESDYKHAGCPYISRAVAYRGLARMVDLTESIGTALPDDTGVHPAH